MIRKASRIAKNTYTCIKSSYFKIGAFLQKPRIYPTNKLTESPVRFKTFFKSFFKTCSKDEPKGSLSNYLSRFKKNCDRVGDGEIQKNVNFTKIKGRFLHFG